MIGVQAVAGGLIGLLLIGALTLSTIAGIAASIHFILAKRYKRALVLLAISLSIAAFAATGWFAVFKTPPRRDVVIDLRRDMPPQWVATNFSSCRPPSVSPATMCDSSEYINNVRLTLPDGIELQATARMMSVSYVGTSSRLRSVNLVVHPYLSTTQTALLHRELAGKLSVGARNASALSKKSHEIEQWLAEQQDPGSPRPYTKRDDHM